jgi:hypothetical protein
VSNSGQSTRRRFLGSTLEAVAAGSLAAPQIVSASALGRGATPPSNRVALAIIGSGGRGIFEGKLYTTSDTCQIVEVCDPQERRRVGAKEALEKVYGQRSPSGAYRGVRTYNDFRDVLLQRDIDAVYIATPDRWHVPITIAAVKAGKDAHTEKPLGVSIEQDLATLKAVRKYGRIFQYGTERRSTPDARHAVELVLNGRIGKVQKIYVVSPGSETGGSPTPVLPVPKGLDYDLWLGPAPEAPFCHDRCLVEGQRNGIFHIFDYAIGFIAGWAAHPLDQVQWWADHSGLAIPIRYEGTGKLPKRGLLNCAYQWDLRCTYENGVVLHFMDLHTFQKYSEAPHPNLGRFGGPAVHNAAIFIGTEGWVAISYEKIATEPAALVGSEIGPDEIHLQKSDSRKLSWIESVRTRKDPVSPVETAVQSDLISHLSDICVRTDRPIRWDPAKKTIVGDEAARKMISRPMRMPWRLS